MILDKINQTDIEQIKHLIADNQTFAITTHYNSDGDAIGSSTALAEVLRQMGKTVKIVLSNGFPAFFKWMKGTEEILNFERKQKEVSAYLDKVDVIICLDMNQLNRVEKMEPILANCPKPRIVIDHHLGLDIENEAAISVPEASSTCELVYYVIQMCGLEKYISTDVAESLYTGLITDTGRLDYSSSYADVYQVVGALVEKGIRKNYIHDKIYNVFTYDRMQLLATLLHDNFVYLPDLHAVYMTISLKDQKDHNFQLGDSESFVNYPLMMKDVKVCALFTEYENKTVKVSLRSKRDFSVCDFAKKYFNGGGHFNASGGKFVGTLQEATETFVQGLRESCRISL